MSKYWTKQRDMFLELYSQENHICILCDKNIDAVCQWFIEAHIFAHILRKWLRPRYRHDPRNICLVCSKKCHNDLDTLLQKYLYIINDLLNKNHTRHFIQDFIKNIVNSKSIWGWYIKNTEI